VTLTGARRSGAMTRRLKRYAIFATGWSVALVLYVRHEAA
jgi:hypothetical protein